MTLEQVSRSRLELIEKYVPGELQELPQWVTWANIPKAGKFTKVPYCAGNGGNASTNNSSTWSDFRTAIARFGRDDSLHGIGFVFCSEDPYVGIDLDDCRNFQNGELSEFARAVLQVVDSYAEVSPSGSGIKIFCRGKIAHALRIVTPHPLEIYSTARYFTVTGEHIRNTPLTVNDAQDALTALVQTYGGTQPANAVASSATRTHLVPKGGQHNWLISRAASYRRLGDDEATIYAKLELDYRNHCEPPHDDLPHLRQIARSYARYEGGNPAAGIVVESESREPDIADLPEAVLDGCLGELCDSYLSDFPRAYAYISLVAAASVLVTPNPGAALRTNIFAAPVGPVHSGKSQAIGAAQSMLGVPRALIEDSLAGSWEGLAEKIGARTVPVLISPDELGHLLQKGQILNASFPKVLCKLFYFDDVPLIVKNRVQIPFSARASILGGLVDDEFGDLFGAGTTTGLYDRFAFGLCPSGFSYVYGPWPSAVFDITAKRIFQPLTNADVLEWTRDLQKVEPRLNPRVVEIGLRFASICAAFDGRSELQAAQLGPAIELIRYQTRIRLLLQPNPGKTPEGMVQHRLLTFLRSHKGQWFSPGQALQRSHSYEYGAPLCNRVIGALEYSGDIEVQSENSPGPGPKTRRIRVSEWP